RVFDSAIIGGPTVAGYAGLTIGPSDGFRPHLKLEGGVANPAPSPGDIWQDTANHAWIFLNEGNYLLNSALVVDKTGSTNNLFLGRAAGNTTLTGAGPQASNNVAVGMGSASNLTTGYQNTTFGAGAGGSLTSDVNNVLIGWNAAPSQSG